MKESEVPLLADMHVDGVRFNRELLTAHQQQISSDLSKLIQSKPE